MVAASQEKPHLKIKQWIHIFIFQKYNINIVCEVLQKLSNDKQTVLTAIVGYIKSHRIQGTPKGRVVRIGYI